MNFLEITFIPPSKNSGGGLGVYQSIKTLASIGTVDYIGPQYDEGLFSDCPNKVNNKFLESNRVNHLKFLYRLMFKKISTSFYDSWKIVLETIDWSIYDLVHIEFSRYDFLVDICHNHNKKCIVRVHNIEADYGKNIFNLSKNLLDYVRYRSFEINEKSVFNKADYLICITREDIKRAKELYGICNHMGLNPVCLDYKPRVKHQKDDSIVFLITGSLGYGPNADGAEWYISNVWKDVLKMYKDAKLIVAGGHPNSMIKTICESAENVTLIDTPLDMEPYFREADIYIASVFDGAGMKVKVAEALSYGLPVIGTEHAFIGYEEVVHGKYISKTKEEFIENIEKVVQNVTEKERSAIIDDYKSFLSIDTSIKRYKAFIKEVIR